MQFTITIDDPDLLAGLSAARNEARFATDQEYLQHVIDKAAESWAKRFSPVIVEAKETIEVERKRLGAKFEEAPVGER